MAVMLSHLVARTPTVEDSYSIAELVAACDSAEDGSAESSSRDLASVWQHSSFDLESDAWVIVNSRKQFAAFACVWHRDHEEFSTFICVHPQYRQRGIGTLLLRIAEQHARKLMRLARPGEPVSLRSIVSAKHAQARCLFEREGYLAIREFWRVTLEQVESSGEGVSHAGKFTIDLEVESGQLVGTTPLYDREGVYSVRQFVTYEKELRLAYEACACPADSAETLIGVCPVQSNVPHAMASFSSDSSATPGGIWSLYNGCSKHVPPIIDWPRKAAREERSFNIGQAVWRQRSFPGSAYPAGLPLPARGRKGLEIY